MDARNRQMLRQEIDTVTEVGAGKSGLQGVILKCARAICHAAGSTSHWARNQQTGETGSRQGKSAPQQESHRDAAQYCVVCKERVRSVGFLHDAVVVHFLYCRPCATRSYRQKLACNACGRSDYTLVSIEN